ncbi:MAG: proton-conducting membrane transporter [Defluviitaleaceae bacterium]|nr:proton-conducting membrane transporter [Defluviitaleaceae bacterium]
MLPYFVIAPLLIAVFLYLFSSSRTSRIVAIIAQAVFVGFTLFLFLESRQGEIYTVVGGYRGVLGITLSADMLSASLVMLTAVLFLIAAVYGLKEPSSKLYWLLMFIWEGLIIGVFFARDFFNVFVLLEVATLIVAVLIMYVREKRSMYDGVIFLMVNTVAIQFYLLGVGYIYMLTGTLDMAMAAVAIADMEASRLILPYTLIMAPIVFKCALVPLASWLPKVQGIPRAPSAVAAILSGLHVKCALFLFIRFQEVFSPVATDGFYFVLGIVTALASIVMAFAQKDIRLILAYSSTAQVGLIMAGLNIGGEYAVTGSLFHIINHAVFKAALFLGAGIIVRMYRTRDITKISGLMKRSPVLGITTIMAILGIAGAPFFNGSISKYFMMAESGGVVFWILNIINLGTITLFVKYARMLFGEDTSNKTVQIDVNKQISVAVLAVMCLAMGIGGVWLANFLFGVDVGLSFWGYLEKSAIFAVSVAIAVVVNRYANKEHAFFTRVRGLDLSFKGMCLSIGVLFATLLFFVEVTI